MQFPAQKLRDSFFLMVGRRTAAPEAEISIKLDALRASMIASLGPSGAAHFPRLVLDLRTARGREELWQLREPLMTALSTHGGEASARKALGEIDPLFGGALSARCSKRPA
ncbi:hypothetical protein BH11PSE7_BH11PSE7_17450 [soil metagenome]